MQHYFSTVLLPVYEKIKPLVYKMNNVPHEELADSIFKASLMAGFVKCFEYNYDINKLEDDNHSFYLTPFLRGICEDLISLKFIAKHPHKTREKIVGTLMLYLLNESVGSQANFFDKEKVLTPIVRLKDAKKTIDGYEADLKAIWAGLGYNKDKMFPSVSQMATDTAMQGIYDFIYHATSRAVHFSPNILLRMGWFKDEDTGTTFTTKNFSNYYWSFNIYYGTYLFLKYVKELKKELALNKLFLTEAKELKKAFLILKDCPEIVTFEEMNMKRPFSIITILADTSLRFKDSL